MKKNNSDNYIKSLFVSFKKYYVPFSLSILLLLISVACSIIIPSQIQNLTNVIGNFVSAQIKSGTYYVDFSKVTQIGIVLICLIAGAWISQVISGFILNVCIQKYSKELRNDIYSKINKLPLSYFDNKQIGDILSILANDVDALSTALQNSLSALIQGVALLFGVIIAMFISCWQLAVAVICSVPIMVVALFINFKVAGPYFNANQERLGALNSFIEENISGHIIVKAFGQEEREKEEFKKRNISLKKSLFSSQNLGGFLEPIMSLISFLTYAAVLILGGILFHNGTIDFGLITGFIVYVSLFQQPLSLFGQVGITIQSGLAGCKRVFEFLKEKELPDESYKEDKLDLDHINGDVEFKDVCFGYKEDKLTIKNFTLKVKKGMKVAIVGPTGAGKTTLVNLLMRFYETKSGDILIDNVSIHDMNPKEVRKVFGMILQDTWIINGTIRENIVYNNTSITEEELDHILVETNLKHFVETLPLGLDTVIQDESALSSGQKQLVTIARAMVENAPLLILDEATSNVDTRTEILIQNAMDALTKGRTSFVIAHRLSTIKNADLIITMQDGNVVETGNHESLLKNKGLYYQIYNSQFTRN